MLVFVFSEAGTHVKYSTVGYVEFNTLDLVCIIVSLLFFCQLFANPSIKNFPKININVALRVCFKVTIKYLPKH